MTIGVIRIRWGDAGRDVSCAVVLALGWLFERATGEPSPSALPLAWIERHPLQLLAALALGSVLARLWDGKLTPAAHVSDDNART